MLFRLVQINVNAIGRSNNVIDFLRSDCYVRFKADSEASNNIYWNRKCVRSFVGIEILAHCLALY